MLYVFVILLTCVLCREDIPGQKKEAFQKFKPYENEMIFVSEIMKNMHSKNVNADNPVLQLPETT